MVDEVLYEMQCTLHIDIEVLRSSSTIPYKYIVCSPKRKVKDSFEFIHHAPGHGIINRCLAIPRDVLQASGWFVIIICTGIHAMHGLGLPMSKQVQLCGNLSC